MGLAKEHRPVKLIVGMFTAQHELLDVLHAELAQSHGPADHISPLWPFEFTTYYAQEFGHHLLRQFISFEALIDAASLPAIKLFTNDLEQEFALGGKRQINLDPGYVDLSKLVLATTKNHQHRIYLRGGIFAEVTLRYTRQSFRPWEWTYPDYRTDHYIQFFNQVRQTYLAQLRKL